MNNQPSHSILNTLRSGFAKIFGKIQWNSPPWLVATRQKAKQAPKTFWGLSLLGVALLLAAAYSLYSYQHRPKPVYISASITIPDITTNAETLVPNNLFIDFGIQKNGLINQSVAPIALVGKAITEGIDISPHIAGLWSWNSDSQLLFTPTEDWQAGQKYTIRCAKNFFVSQIPMESYTFSFTTKPFEATIREFKFYQDPVNSEVHKAVATIEFNYPVNSDSLAQNTSLVFQTLNKDKGASVAFSYTYDAHKRIAYLQSENISLNNQTQYLLLTLNKAVNSATDSTHLQTSSSKNLLIPNAQDFLQIVTATANIVRNDKDKPEQILTIETSLGVNEQDFNQSVHAYLLPKDYPATATEAAKPNYSWQNPGEVTAPILALATPLNKEAIPSEYNYATVHSFKFAAQTPRSIYITIDKGMKGFGSFTLSKNYAAVLPVPELPKEISFLHKGSLMALSGEKKLSVLIRGVPAVKFDFARVLPNNINQLVTQTQGDFNNPYFINPTFNQQNISELFSEIKQFDTADLTKQQYTALDLDNYLTPNANTPHPKGLFLLQARGWDVTNNTPLDVKASRLILVTDLGMLVKDNQDGSHDVFVSSITEGAPAAQVTIQVLGKNGLPISTGVSDDQGRVHFPTLKDFVEDQEPTVYLASINNDLSFIPFNNFNRQLNFSKFDIGGIYTNNQDAHSLSAYLFSDRGIYRPGDSVHIGMIVKQAFAQAQPAGLPLQATIVDARGTTIYDKKITLNDTGYMELEFATNETSPTGLYTVNLFLVKDDHPQNLLGTTSVNVAAFQPDRMRISAHLLPQPSEGWSNPIGLKGKVSLNNLYGAPATHRKISAKIMLSPEPVKFDQYPNYVFVDPLLDPKKPQKTLSETLSETTTNEKGEAEFNLNLERFEKATYQLSFFAEGFEADGGRSVTAQAKTLVSPLPYFIGYKSDGDLNFIKQNSKRSINYLAINPQLNKEAVQDLRIQLTSSHPITSLVKNPNGTYQYQSVMQSTVIKTQTFSIPESGVDYSLPTEEIGNYTLAILNKDNTVLSQLKFTVVGASQQPLAKNAELSIHLNKTQYQANEDIELQITAPYTGTGLITIERDKVYAAQWFKAQTTNSIASIHIPADFEGDGYINVTFIRDWESPELFISPLSYAVVPFSINHDKHAINIELSTPKLARPGESFTIDYKSDKAGKIIVFAVDEGILQVARYVTPDPLAFFFQKHALEVWTQQTIDQIIPKFIQARELSATGGDDGEANMASHLNPFKRKTDLPVVYWSGIIDTDSTTRQLTYTIPDYFNGRMRIMAVAVSADSLGSKETSAEVRGDFIINPNVPTFVAPDDVFEISASIANNIKDSGNNTPITIELNASPELKLIGPRTQVLPINEGQEQTVHFKLRATSLGAAKITFTARAGNKSSAMDASLSVRPATPLINYIDSGLSKESNKTLEVLSTLYPQYRNATVSVSNSPLILVFGLQRYLDNYPYGCTEQLTSKALPLLAMHNQPWFSKDSNLINEKVNATIQSLSQRQMSNGGFSYWPGLSENQGNNFASVYAMQFLTEAREQGFTVPHELFANGIAYLKNLASQNPTTLDAARIQAYAIYILTRNELVTSNYLTNVQLYLQRDPSKTWQKDSTAVYLAASYQLLHSYAEANQLIALYQPQKNPVLGTDFYDNAISDAQYLYIVAKHFPNLLTQVGDNLIARLVEAINNEELNTLLSGYASLALTAYQEQHTLEPKPPLSITEILRNNKEETYTSQNGSYLQQDISEHAKQIRLENPDKKTFFYQFLQSGFNKTLPTTPLKQGIEIVREYRDAQGKVILSTTLGSTVEVHIKIRALDNHFMSNIAITDLLPGGFEVVRDSVQAENMDYADAREDRVNYFGSVDSSTKEITYKIKAINTGTYILPPIYAQAMYNPSIKAWGVAGTMVVTEK